MGINIVIIILSAIIGWFILEGAINAKHVITRNQDDVHWIAAAGMTALLLFIVGMITLSCVT